MSFTKITVRVKSSTYLNLTVPALTMLLGDGNKQMLYMLITKLNNCTWVLLLLYMMTYRSNMRLKTFASSLKKVQSFLLGKLRQVKSQDE